MDINTIANRALKSAGDAVAAEPTAAEKLAALAADEMRAVNALIIERMGSPVPLIPKLGKYLVEAGGKRVRPLVTIAAANMIGYSGDAHLKLAAAVEFIHTATLLHDDVVDDSDLRRGKKAANLVWGNAPSVLVGDFLFARAFMLMVDAGSMEALRSLSRASSVIAEGEVRQLAAKGDIDASVGSYMEIIEAKTAALFASAAEVPAIVAKRSAQEIEALDTYGRELGLAFQLIDDALDYGGLAQNLGKNTGDDFREGKVTIPVVLALQKGTAEEKTFWSRVMADGEQTDGDYEIAMDYLQRHDALRGTIELAAEKANTARTALDIFPDNQWKTALQDLTDFVVQRAS
ncbi:polyprenyl synthetase family protein [Hyphobacterium sp.]|uniref:polyprenyl synthetase family protein n=1 Tax=Hyphobacterium sp. TaxID=2004662 RepID=UPI003BAB2E09